MTNESERAAFEKWIQTTAGWKACKQRGKPMSLRQNMDGSYNDFRVNDRWFAYLAAWKESCAHLIAEQEKAEAVPCAWHIVDAKGKKFTIWNPELAKAIKETAERVGSTLTIKAVCDMPEQGWFCTRGEGHTGPCASWTNPTCPTCNAPVTTREHESAYDTTTVYEYTPPAPSADRVAAQGGDELVEQGAIALWHRFGETNVEEWEDEVHQDEYRLAAEAVLALRATPADG